MDPFSAEGELLTIHNAFHQGQYQAVLDFDTSSLSQSNTTTARVLKLRAQIANGDVQGALASIEKEKGPDFDTVRAFAQHAQGETSTAEKQVEQLVEKSSENATVQILGGIVLQAAGRTEEALSLLSKHQGNLEAIAIITQIHLQQNRTDLALKEVAAARKWAQDSLLVNIAESWVGTRVVCLPCSPNSLPQSTQSKAANTTSNQPIQGGESYQSAFYVFEEMAQTPSSTSAKSLVAQAITELHLGRLPEAEAALNQALQQHQRQQNDEGSSSSSKDDDVEAVANAVVLATLMGKREEQERYLKELKGGRGGEGHALVVDLEEKGRAFDAAAGKYAAKVAS
ncbi:MAG: hypothetical protein LQ350_003204 [Teloschistes chrysophthalmus]|nr:MAG: hypothetical protein LQ350_003204 [Niorma chrysophthalma]